MRCWVLICAGLFFTGLCLAQSNSVDTTRNAIDTTRTPSDSILLRKGNKIITIESYARRFNPRKALLYSAVFPGAGQFYNKKYWKVPLVYGGFATLLIVVKSYQDQHVNFRNDLFALVSNKTTSTNPNLKSPQGYTEQQLRAVVDKARRERDYFIILTGFWYLLQMVDAHVDAHLKEFDLNPQLRVRVEPMMDQSYLTGRSTGLALKIKF